MERPQPGREDKQQTIVNARLRLRDRFAKKMDQTPSRTDDEPQGSGPINRHGMPKLPIDQTSTEKWPVLDLGFQPEIAREDWLLVLDGACNNPVTIDWNAFLDFDQIDDVSDFHCVTKWSRHDVPWRGVRLYDLAALADLHESATHVMCHASDDYTTNLSLEEALKPDVLLVYEADGGPLPREHGGPVRVITPQLYAWKGAKWISRLEFMEGDRRGFWEERGYSNTAYPWRNDRYHYE